ncbi:MAG: hypothetical protein Q8Q41_02190 [bacterium]|nr:hypothetical protein [bacterium]
MTGSEILGFLVVSPLLIAIVMLSFVVAWCVFAAVCLIPWGICRGAAWVFSKLF